MISKISLMLLMMAMSFGVMAQNQTGADAVSKGAKVDYKVDSSTSTYAWKVQVRSGGSAPYTWTDNNADFTMINFSETGKEGKTITWNTVGYYRVVMTETTDHSCSNTPNYLEVEVKDNSARATYSFVANTGYCASEDAMKPIVLTVNKDAAATLKYPLTLKYKVTLEGSASSVLTKTIAALGVVFPSIAEITGAAISAGSTDFPVKFEVVSVTDGYGALIPAGVGGASKDITIYRNPAPRNILHN